MHSAGERQAEGCADLEALHHGGVARFPALAHVLGHLAALAENAVVSQAIEPPKQGV